MNVNSMIKAVNLTDGDVLTLEKAKDRMEFEALPLELIAQQNRGACDCFIAGKVDVCKPDCFINL